MPTSAEKELKQTLDVIDRFSGKYHYLHLALSWELANLYSERDRNEDAKKIF